jgi:hypothetical protein
MREVSIEQLGRGLTGERAAFVACLATILELSAAELPGSPDIDDRPPGPLLSRWLAPGGCGYASRAPSYSAMPGARSYARSFTAAACEQTFSPTERSRSATGST